MAISIKSIFRETLRGKSLYRSLQNQVLKNIQLSGQGIDLGAKSDASSYYRFFPLAADSRVTFTDLHPASPTVLKANIEECIPVEDESQDFLLLINVLEHVYRTDRVVAESFRALKPGGRLIGGAPFINPVHPDPDDFFRFTSSSLKRLFQEAGFSNIEITPFGYGPFSVAAYLCAPLIKLKLLVSMVYLFGIGLDKLLNYVLARHPRVAAENFPLGYVFICTR